MIANKIIRQAAAEGVELVISDSGALKASGRREAVLRWQPVIREHKSTIVTALSAANNATCDALDERASGESPEADVATATQVPHLRWHIVIPGRTPFMTVVVPEATPEWMRDFYPMATAIEPIEERPKRRATAAEASELASLVHSVLGDDTGAVRQEALDVALADPLDALVCYTALTVSKAVVS